MLRKPGGYFLVRSQFSEISIVYFQSIELFKPLVFSISKSFDFTDLRVFLGEI